MNGDAVESLPWDDPTRCPHMSLGGGNFSIFLVVVRFQSMLSRHL